MKDIEALIKQIEKNISTMGHVPATANRRNGRFCSVVLILEASIQGRGYRIFSETKDNHKGKTSDRGVPAWSLKKTFPKDVNVNFVWPWKHQGAEDERVMVYLPSSVASRKYT